MSSLEPVVQLVLATAYLDPEGSIVESSLRLAEAVVSALRNGYQVKVDLAGIKGASSSYFNVLLLRVRDEFGLKVISTRLCFRFSSEMQEKVFKRSFDAVERAQNPPPVTPPNG